MDSYLLQNAFVQIYLSLFFFYQETKCFHMDSHWGNFLYHKIKPGGYFHYKIFGKDYYLENLGFLWVVWDFGLIESFKYKKNKYPDIFICEDIIRISCAFFNSLTNWIPYQIKISYDIAEWLSRKYKLNEDFVIIIKNVYNDIFIDHFFLKVDEIKEGKYEIKKYGEKYKYNVYDGFISYNDKVLLVNYKNNNDLHDYIHYTPNNMNQMIKCIMNTFIKYELISNKIKDKTKIINKKPYFLSQFKY